MTPFFTLKMGGNSRQVNTVIKLKKKKKITGHGKTNWFQIGKVVRQGCILSLCLFNLYAEYIMRKHKLESRLLGEISVTSDMQMTPPLWQKVKN